MELELFGFKLGKNKKDQTSENRDVITPDSYDGSYVLETGGVFGTFIDFSGAIRDENQMIQHYRSMALYPEVDSAIEDIVNEAIVLDQDRKPVKLNLDHVNLSDTIKTKIYFEDDLSKRVVETTIWGITDDKVILKQGTIIPINRIYYSQ